MTEAMATLRLTIMCQISQDLLVDFQGHCYDSLPRIKNLILEVRD